MAVSSSTNAGLPPHPYRAASIVVTAVILSRSAEIRWRHLPAAKGQIARFQSPPGGRSACSGLFATPLAQPPGRAWWQRLPARYDARALPRLHVVRDAGKQPAQLDRGRQLALLLECGTDRGGVCFGNNEHLGSMVKRARTGKRRVRRSAFRPAHSSSSSGSLAPHRHPGKPAEYLPSVAADT
jgi:hypothetical protein